MSKQRKVFIVQGGHDYLLMFLNRGWLVADTVEEADLVQFCGGSDVTPSYYDQYSHPRTRSSTVRDQQEVELVKLCVKMSVPMAGICRGGQFLNVLNGGGMYQHVNGHATGHTHTLTDTRTGKQYQVSSTHHQMMIAGNGGEVVAIASESSSKEYMEDTLVVTDTDTGTDTEAVIYKAEHTLCYQPHPEFYDVGNPCQDYYFELLEEVLHELH